MTAIIKLTKKPSKRAGGGPAFSMDQKGLHVTRQTGESPGEAVWVSARFEVVGRCRNPEGGDWSVLIRWKDNDRREHQRYIGHESLLGEPVSVCGPLAGEGLEINRAEQRSVLAYLSAAKAS